MSENPGGRSRTTWSLGFPLQVHCRNLRISRTRECSGHLGRWWICCVPLVSCVSRLQIQPFRNQPKHQNCTFKIDLQLIENSFGINMDREFLEWNTMKPQIHFRIHRIRRRPVYYPPPVVPPPSLTCVFAIHGSDLTWRIQMRSKMLRWGNVVVGLFFKKVTMVVLSILRLGECLLQWHKCYGSSRGLGVSRIWAARHDQKTTWLR